MPIRKGAPVIHLPYPVLSWLARSNPFVKAALLVVAFGLGMVPHATAVAGPTVAVGSVVEEYIGGGLELAVIPQPQQAILSDRLLVVPGLRLNVAQEYLQTFTVASARAWMNGMAEFPAEAKGACPLLLGELGDESAADRLITALQLHPDEKQRRQMGSQGYTLFVGQAEKYPQGVIAIAGVGAEGTYFGLQSLKQLSVVKDGKLYVRTGTITDWPEMEWRGSKRPAAWEDAYKANWGRLRGAGSDHPFRVDFAAGADPQRQLKSWERGTDARRTASGGLDASDAYIDHLVAQWKAAYKATGQPFFSLKGDDIELALDKRSGTHKQFQGDVGAAFVHLLTELDRRVKKIDPRCTVYWMPNPYYTINWDFVPLSRQVRRAGGIPSGVGLWWTGHHVFSPVMTAESIRSYQQAFYGENPIRVKGLIYDNHGRANDYGGRADDFFAMPRRDPDLADYLRGISNERGSAINRITSYDFQWNPRVYDPQRSLKLAARELSAGDAAYWRAIMQFVRVWEGGRYPTTKETTHAKVADQQRELMKRLAEIEKRIQTEGTRALDAAGAVDDRRNRDFRRQFQQAILGSIELKRDIFAHLDTMWRDGNAPALLIDGEQAPTIDGQLSETIYRRAPTLDRFVTSGKTMRGEKGSDGEQLILWEIPEGTVPEELATQVWIFADEKHAYVAARCRDRLYPLPPGQEPRRAQRREKVEEDYPYNWRQPCLDINLDVHHDHKNTFHVIVDPLGQVYDEYLGWPGDKLATGPPWNGGHNVQVARDGDTWTLELAIPLGQLGLESVERGQVWGINVYRSGLNIVSMHSLLKDTGPYGVRYPKAYGHLHWKPATR